MGEVVDPTVGLKTFKPKFRTLAPLSLVTFLFYAPAMRAMVGAVIGACVGAVVLAVAVAVDNCTATILYARAATAVRLAVGAVAAMQGSPPPPPHPRDLGGIGGQVRTTPPILRVGNANKHL